MRLATYAFDDGIGVAAVLGDEIVDLRQVAGGSMRGLLARGEAGLAAVRLAADAGPIGPLQCDRLLAPVPDPGAFLGVGLNYKAHAAEMGRALPQQPAVFAKLTACINPPFGTILRDPAAPSLDYEGELGIVIGRTCHRVKPEEAPAMIAGYVVVNDISVRERIAPDAVLLAKSAVSHGPFGPWLVTSDEVGDPHDLGIRTWVNDELRQDGTTADLHFSCFDLVSRLSAALTLQPGDIITTGSPSGSGSSFKPPRWLKPGDVVRVEIDRIGAIEHRVADEEGS
jgi:2-keto-4-pentenoate hydratase/2-oxohepta-3-ene-1,7-dioic acid hydratase in catechol pathway